MQEYARYLYCVRDDFFDKEYSLQEITDALGRKEKEEADDVIRIESALVIFNLLGSDTTIIVDERKLEKIDNVAYEKSDKIDEYFSKMSKRYSQSGMLLRLSGNESGRFYTDYSRVQAMLNGYFGGVLENIDKANMIVLSNTNTSEYYDTYIYSVLAILQGYKVYYLCDGPDGEAKIAKLQQKSLYKFMINFISSENQPYYIKLGLSQIVNKGNAVLLRDYGNLVDMYSRILKCSIDESSEEESPELLFYKLSDIDKFITTDYINDKYTSNQTINVKMSDYISGIKLTHHIGKQLSDQVLEFEDTIEGLLGEGSRCNRFLCDEITPVLSEKYETYKGSATGYSILVNGRKTLLTKNIIDTTILNEFAQQYCNILSELFYSSKKPVYLQDIAILSYNGEKLLTVQESSLDVRHDLIVDLNIEIAENDKVESKFRIIGDNSPLLKVNAPMFNDDYEWVNYTTYQQSLMVKSMYSFITQHSKMNVRASNIPLLDRFCKDNDNTFRDDEDTMGLLKRRALLYYSLEKIKMLTLDNYINIPRSYRDAHLDAFGDFGSAWGGREDSLARKIVLKL